MVIYKVAADNRTYRFFRKTLQSPLVPMVFNWRERAYMKGLNGDHTGCTVLIYDTEGNHLESTVIKEYDKVALRIEVQKMPAVLSTGASCKVLILTAPSPCEYHGRVISDARRSAIALYQGHEKENRSAVRYRMNAPALIDNLICDGRAYPLFSPLEVCIVNISKSGVRFKAPNYSFIDGDRFQMRMKISENDKLLIAVVVNQKDVDNQTSEYGCQFLIGK